jgi:hypothetical protein
MWTWSLAQELGTSEFPADERTTKALASQAEAMLFLIDLRLRDFGRVLRGELDPAALVTQRILVHADDTPTNPRRGRGVRARNLHLSPSSDALTTDRARRAFDREAPWRASPPSTLFEDHPFLNLPSRLL